MLHIKTKEEIELIRESSLLVSKTLTEIAQYIKPGISTIKLDKIAEDFIASQNAIPAFKGYNGFPASLCISANDAVVHGIPNEYKLQDGDIISIDCGVIKNNFFGDSAYTFIVGDVADEIVVLLEKTKQSLYLGIEQAIVGNRVGDIGFAIQNFTEVQNSYGVVRELVGHGVGRALHEDPEVPNYGKKGEGAKLKEGMVIAVEPMINLGDKAIYQEDDGWTIRTTDNKPSAHFEHTIAIGKGSADILSSFEGIEAAVMANNNLKVLAIT